MPSPQSGMLDQRCDRFEAEWKAGRKPRIEDYLQTPAEVQDAPARRELLIELVMIDLEYRWRTGDALTSDTATACTGDTNQPDAPDGIPARPLLEDYVHRYSELGPLEDLSEDVIAGEYKVRHLWGDRPKHQEYLGRLSGRRDSLPELLNRVDGDLVVDETIDVAGEPTPQAPSPPEPSLPTIQGYQLIEKIGEGGMGTVYKARQINANRLVALKTLKAGRFATQDDIERFRVEAEASANLDHPNIVTVHEVGESDGHSFFSMDYVEGRNLDEIRRNKTLTGKQAAAYAKSIAEAIHYAHQNGILHRDIKPSNILIDPSNRPIVTDFGLAKLSRGESDLTASGQLLGTPSYMSPEQASGKRDEVGPLTDVYSLGASLYALIAGRPPFVGADPIETIRQVEGSDPIPPRQLNATVPRDLEVVCLKCLEKEPKKRYASAAALALDLGRYLDGSPIEARPAGVVERTVRWCRRKPWKASVAALGAFATLLLLTLAITSTLAAQEEERLRKEAEEGKGRAERMQRLAEVQQTRFGHRVGLLELSAGQFRAAIDMLADVPATVASWDTAWLRHQTSFRPRVKTTMAKGHWATLAAALNSDRSRLVTSDASGMLIIWDVDRGVVERTLTDGRWSKPSSSAPFASRAVHYVEGRSNDSDMSSWEECFVALSWLPDDSRILAASLNGRVLSFHADGGGADEILTANEPLLSMAVSAEGRCALFGGGRGRIFSRSLTTDESQENRDSESPAVAVARDDANGCWVIGRENGQVQLVDDDLVVKSETTVSAPVWCLDVGQQEEQNVLAVGCGTPHVCRFSIEEQGTRLQPVDRLALPESQQRPAEAVYALGFSSDCSLLYAGDDWGRVALWDAASGQVARTLDTIADRDSRRSALENLQKKKTPPQAMPFPMRRVISAILDRKGGSEIITAADDAAIKTWDLERATRRGTVDLPQQVGPHPRIVFDRLRPEVLWALGRDGILWAIDTRTRKTIGRKKAHSGGSAGLTVAGESGVVVSIGGDRLVQFWTLSGSGVQSAHLEELKHARSILSVAVSPKNRWIAVVDDQAKLSVWDYQSGEHIYLTELSSATTEPPVTGALAFNCDGTRLAACGANQSAPVFATQPFRRMPEQLQVAGSGGQALIWSPTDPRVALISDDHPRYATSIVGGIRTEVDNHRAGLRPETTCVAMTSTPDKRRLVLLEDGGRLLFLDPEYFVELHQLRNPKGLDSDLAFDPTGERLALAGVDGSLQVLETARATPAATLEPINEISRWKMTPLVAPSTRTLATNDRCVALDRQGRVCLVLVESSGENGHLYFLRHDGEKVVKELLEVDGTIADRKVKADAAALAIQGDGEPAVVYRRVTELLSPYDGSFQQATRRGPNDWIYEAIEPHGNLGFYPSIVQDSSGSISEVFHYAFAGNQLIRSQRTSEGWRSEPFGIQGDGLRFWMRKGKADNLHFVFQSHRFNTDPRPYMYGVWDGKNWSHQVIDPSGSASNWLQLLPDGTPVVMISETETDGVTESRYLARFAAGGWEKWLALPTGLNPLWPPFAIGSRGETYSVSWDQTQRELLLWTHAGSKWSAATIAGELPDAPPNWCSIRTTPSGGPIVVVGSLNKPFGWILLLQPGT